MARTKTKGTPAAAPPTPPSPPPAASAGYTVVARRYRPQRFEDVVGQDHVVQTLRNAIRFNRVTHAYVFSGTRGVGKTSVARIFAKCLNCGSSQGPTETPCLNCDICQAIAAGQDVDVIEIDGASNNGVEAVRELRQNASLRPSRARYKIYYIDEVHMLSPGAFNALLKTLEEPPAHVKFFFATTEANKIPDTVLSRCQKFDFAGIPPAQIAESLGQICAREQVEADPDALQAVARRAGGSLRDAQSLLEQLLSPGERRLTSDLVHQALGTAPDEGLADLIEALADRDPARALRVLDATISGGVQPADLLSGLLEFTRDVLVLAVRADVPLLAAPPALKPRLQAVAERWPLDTILAAQQVLAEARSRLRGSPHGRLLAELAVVRTARLENFTDLGELTARLAELEQNPAAPAALVKKKPGPADGRPTENGPSVMASRSLATPAASADPRSADLSLEAVHQVWSNLVGHVGVRLGMPLSQVRPTAISPPDVVVIALPAGYNWIVEQCGTPEAQGKIEEGLAALLGRKVSIQFERAAGSAEPEPPAAPPQAAQSNALAADPLAQKVVELFQAQLVQVDGDATSQE